MWCARNFLRRHLSLIDSFKHPGTLIFIIKIFSSNLKIWLIKFFFQKSSEKIQIFCMVKIIEKTYSKYKINPYTSYLSFFNIRTHPHNNSSEKYFLKILIFWIFLTLHVLSFTNPGWVLIQNSYLKVLSSKILSSKKHLSYL